MKYKLLFMLSTLLFTSCVTNKTIHVAINNSEYINIDPDITGSVLEDLAPSLEIPLLP